tara:strand:- start:64044 stop:64466 length:423 start_codon:yes stop_codon:yes gene_type:complete
MSTQRHWKQKFDANARFVYRKRRKFALSPTGMMEPGELMPSEVQVKVGRHRLKMWWRAGWIELADYVPAKPYTVRMAEQAQANLDSDHNMGGPSVAPDAPPAEATEGLAHVGGGWYDVTLEDGSTERVHGKTKAQELLRG